MLRVVDSNLMPLAATIVVAVYAAGVIFRRSGLWYEWLAVAAGVGFAIWFWFTEYKRAQRRKGK
jgi:hypothetical protein